MLADGEAVKAIPESIQSNGYSGSYSLLQQYCEVVRSSVHRTKKNTRKVKRKTLSWAIWSGETELSDEDLA